MFCSTNVHLERMLACQIGAPSKLDFYTSWGWKDALLGSFTEKLNGGEITENSGDLNNKHLNNGNIWKADFYKYSIQIIHYSDARLLLLTGQENCGQIVRYSDHHLNNRLK